MDFETLFQEKPQEWHGLLIYPVTMKDYPLFLAVRECVAGSQQTWPAPWCAMKYLDGLIGMGFLPKLALLLRLALRLPDGGGIPVYPRTVGGRITSLMVIQGERQVEITAKNFGALRELIAQQNGIKLPDEMANAELLQAQQDRARSGDTVLKPDLEALVYSVALKAGVSPQEVMEWTVRRFQATERAIDRTEGHRMAGITLAAGGKFKGGNPYPSWKYDREEQTNGVEPLSALSGRLAGSVEQK